MGMGAPMSPIIAAKIPALALETICLFVFMAMFSCSPATTAELACSHVRNAYSLKGFSSKSVPREPVSGEHLRICQQGRTCCTEEMEQNLEEQSKLDFDRILEENIDNLRKTFTTRTQKFHDFFVELLDNSKKDFHEMFTKTYGVMYEQNAYIFKDLFEQLEKYYTYGNVNLAVSMEDFFTTLYQKMFKVFNAQYTFDNKYLACVSEFMDELQPFGDVPRKLSLQVKRAFVASRVFIRSLATGRDVVKSMISVPASANCTKALMRMNYCPQCLGLLNLKPCSTYCLNVMKGCLAPHADLDNDWNNYIDALLLLAERLEGPFNIESVVEPIDIKISDAIMNFQESGIILRDKVFEGCGQPRLGRRDVSHELTFDTLKFNRGGGGNVPRPTTAAGTSLDRLVRDIRSKIKTSRSFWTNLPNQMCSKETPLPLTAESENDKDDDKCWDGLSKAKYEAQIMSDVGSNVAISSLDSNHHSIIIQEQVFKLVTVTQQLKDAYSGMDVEFPDEADWVSSGSGSGSGDGPGSSVDEPAPGREEPSVESDFGFTTTTSVPEIRRPPPKETKKESDTPSAAPVPPKVKMTLNRAICIIVLPVFITWLGSMF